MHSDIWGLLAHLMDMEKEKELEMTKEFKRDTNSDYLIIIQAEINMIKEIISHIEDNY